MNDSISEKEISGWDLEQIDGITISQMAAKVKNNVTVLSTAKKAISDCMKMLGHGVIASSNLFLLDSYQDLIDIDSELTLAGAIIGIPRKQASYWTIQWENNVITKNSE